MNQRGFATLEVILMVMVIGILASIAVPRFTSVTTAANTAKIQADLSTIDTAISVAAMSGETISEGKVNEKTFLKPYLQDYDKIKPPVGTVYINDGTGTTEITSSMDYQITKDTNDNTIFRATLNSKTASYYTKKTTTGGTTDG